MGTLRDILGFSIFWVPLFGMPLLLVGYVAYLVATRKLRTGTDEGSEYDEHSGAESKSRDSGKKAA